MRKSLGIVISLLFVGFIAACGDMQNDNEITEPDEDETTNPDEEFNDGEMMETGLEFSLQSASTGEPPFVYTVENTGDEEETLSFTTGQRYEYEISQDGEVLHTFSEDRAFTQALEDITVNPGEELTFDVELPDLEPGEYTIKIFLVAAEIAPTSELEETFTVE